jgi:hypothetical protein
VRDGGAFVGFESVTQGSPSFVDPQATTYRHSLGAVLEREGYFYLLLCSCPERIWPELEGLFRKTVDTFRLLPLTADYRSPDTSRLEFW